MPDHAAALADLTEAVGRALIRYAQAIRPADLPAPDPAAGQRPGGKRQRATLELPGIGAEAGLSASEIAAGVGISQPNAYSLATRMVDAGWLVEVVGVEPRRWRLAER